MTRTCSSTSIQAWQNNAQYQGAWWCDAFEFGEGWMGLDTMGHEYTHAVIGASSELVYSGQSGALNESFADIMGVMVDQSNWQIGEDRSCCFGPIRDLSNPPAFNQPDRNSEFVNTGSDNGGVHTNSGINNFAYFLIGKRRHPSRYRRHGAGHRSRPHGQPGFLRHAHARFRGPS